MLSSLRTSFFHVINRRFFYGWIILAVTCFAMIGTGPGQSHLIGLYFEDISREMTFSFAADWMGGNRQTAITFAYGGATFLAAFLLPYVGKLLDRYGPTVILALVIVGLAVTAMLFSLARDWAAFVVAFGFLRFLGQGSLMLASVNMVSQWFDQRRGFALGIMSLGFPLSMAMHPRSANR